MKFEGSAVQSCRLASGMTAQLVKREDCDPARNVYLTDPEGLVVWQIEPATGSHGSVGYSGLRVGQGGELLAYSSNGIEYEIDHSSGRILSKELVR